MSSITDPDGAVMSTLRKLSDIVLCNIAFCGCCLPVITAGASLTALHASMQILAAGRDEEGDTVIKVFFKTFKASFVPSTILWLVTLLMVGFLALYRNVVNRLDGTMARTYNITFYLLAIAFLFGFQYFFPIEARFKLKLRDVLKNSWLLSVAALPYTLITIVITVVSLYISFFMDPTQFRLAIFIWAAIGFGIVTYLNSFFFLKAFETKLGVNLSLMDEDDGEVAEGALFTDEEHGQDAYMAEEISPSMPDWNRREDPEEEARRKQHEADVRGTRSRKRTKEL